MDSKSQRKQAHEASYYSRKLSAERLQRVYEIATPRVRQYLDAEINEVLKFILPGDLILELGCGYGRVMAPLAERARMVIGIDSSIESLRLGRKILAGTNSCRLLCMNAVSLGFPDGIFDLVIGVQNGISAFHEDSRKLIKESLRVTRRGGTILFSTYSDKFWKDRLEWFNLQSRAGLLGEIDFEKTKDGVIVCKDGFTATTVSAERLHSYLKGMNLAYRLVEIDQSSLFCEIIK